MKPKTKTILVVSSIVIVIVAGSGITYYYMTMNKMKAAIIITAFIFMLLWIYLPIMKIIFWCSVIATVIYLGRKVLTAQW